MNLEKDNQSSVLEKLKEFEELLSKVSGKETESLYFLIPQFDYSLEEIDEFVRHKLLELIPIYFKKELKCEFCVRLLPTDSNEHAYLLRLHWWVVRDKSECPFCEK
jgi:hypothetical protein